MQLLCLFVDFFALLRAILSSVVLKKILEEYTYSGLVSIDTSVAKWKHINHNCCTAQRLRCVDLAALWRLLGNPLESIGNALKIHVNALVIPGFPLNSWTEGKFKPIRCNTQTSYRHCREFWTVDAYRIPLACRGGDLQAGTRRRRRRLRRISYGHLRRSEARSGDRCVVVPSTGGIFYISLCRSIFFLIRRRPVYLLRLC